MVICERVSADCKQIFWMVFNLRTSECANKSECLFICDICIYLKHNPSLLVRAQKNVHAMHNAQQ